jgi:hypothetical protein
MIQRAKAEGKPMRLTTTEEYELRRAVVILENLQEAADDGLFDALAEVIDDLYGIIRAASGGFSRFSSSRR